MFKSLFILLTIGTSLIGSEVIVCQINPLSGEITKGDVKIQCMSDLINNPTFKGMYSNGWMLIGTSSKYLFFEKK